MFLGSRARSVRRGTIVRKDVNLPFADYVNTRMHFEKVLVLWGGGGRQKTPTVVGIANHLAKNYGVGHYCKASSPDALKPAQEYFGRCVLVILEELVCQGRQPARPKDERQLPEAALRDSGRRTVPRPQHLSVLPPTAAEDASTTSRKIG